MGQGQNKQPKKGKGDTPVKDTSKANVTSSTHSETDSTTHEPASAVPKSTPTKREYFAKEASINFVEKGSSISAIYDCCKRSKRVLDSETGFSPKKLEKLFATYKEVDIEKAEGEEDYIGPDGVGKFLTDLEVDPEDVVVLVMAWHLKAAQMGYFTQTEFIDGFKSLGVDTLEKIKGKFGMMRDELKDPTKLKEIYKYAFNFAKEDPDKKIVPLDIADGMIKLVLAGKPHVEKFCEFLHTQKEYKVLNSDQWVSFFEFSRTIGPNLEEYDENGAWPVLIDLYVEYLREKGVGGQAKASED